MTISSTITPRIQYAGSGTTGPFNTTFLFLNEADLKVTRTSSLGVDDVLTITADYTVSGGDGSTGSVTLVTALAVGETLTIQRETVRTQETDYIENAKFPAESHETALDRLTLISQELDFKFSLVPTFEDTSAVTDLNFPAPEALKYLRWNSAGNDLENVDGTVAGGGGTMNNVSDDLTPQLGGDLDVNGFAISSTTGNDLDISGGDSGDINIAHGSGGNTIITGDNVFVDSFIKHNGDSDTHMQFTDNTITWTAGNTSVFNITSAGLQLASGARVTEVKDEDDMTSNSNTALATQQSIKAYVDAAQGGSISVQETDTISSEASVEYTVDWSAHKEYVFFLLDLIPTSSSGPRLELDMSDDNGSTYAATVDQMHAFIRGGMVTHEATQDTDSEISGPVHNDSAAIGVTGFVRLRKANSDGSQVFVEADTYGQYDNGGGVELFSQVIGVWTESSTINKVRFQFGGSNTSSGQIRVYRIT